MIWCELDFVILGKDTFPFRLGVVKELLNVLLKLGGGVYVAKAFPLDYDGFGVMQKAVQKS